MSCYITLKEKGLKLTPQRRLIMDIIHESPSGLSGTELTHRVHLRMLGVNKSTVYRTLELLEKEGCVFRSEVGGEYIYHHPEEGQGYHLVCRECGASIDFDTALLLPFEKTAQDRYDFQIDYRHVIIGGLCASCQKKV